MGKVIAQASMSPDGFIADTNDQAGPLFDWYDNGDVEITGSYPGPVFHTSARGPLGAGVLSGKYTSPAAQGEGRRLTDVDPARLKIAETLARVATELGHTPAQVALAWIRAKQAIPILGARTASQLASKLACLDIDLPVGALTRLDQASRVPRGFPHDFLTSADYTLGSMSAHLDLLPGRSRHG